jgi:hypothetical protein
MGNSWDGMTEKEKEKLIVSPTKEGREYRRWLLRVEEETVKLDAQQGIVRFPVPKPPEYQDMPDELWQWFSRV